MNVRWFSMVGLLLAAAHPCDGAVTDVSASRYQGWKTWRLGNEWIEVQVLPDIGGRVVQLKMGNTEFLWVNPQLAGKLPTTNGLAADGGWFNVGGDKLWPAPQGWAGDEQWPGPPDGVLDGQPYALEALPPRPGESAVRLTSRNDARSGIRFSRVIRVYDGSTRVRFEATMTNVDTKPRRWGIWAHTQLEGRSADGSGHNPLMRGWCPLNPDSKFPKGYSVIFGEKDNPSFETDAKRGLMEVKYQYKVGKIGLDSPAGWVATVNGQNGAVFVQRFQFEPKKEYPDGSSVEFWLNGAGSIHAYNKDIPMPDDLAQNPALFESEIISPFARLEPGESYTWAYEWYAANIGGDFPVVDCSEAGVVAEPLRAEQAGGKIVLKGRFGVFAPGFVRIAFEDDQMRPLTTVDQPGAASPQRAVVLDVSLAAPPAAAGVRVMLIGRDGKTTGILARTALHGVDDVAR
jgi:hypothetical protein